MESYLSLAILDQNGIRRLWKMLTLSGIIKEDGRDVLPPFLDDCYASTTYIYIHIYTHFYTYIYMYIYTFTHILYVSIGSCFLSLELLKFLEGEVIEPTFKFL